MDEKSKHVIAQIVAECREFASVAKDNNSIVRLKARTLLDWAILLEKIAEEKKL